jgi:dihydrofolate reductase
VSEEGRSVVGNIALTLDGRVSGPQGDQDMAWVLPHALSDDGRAHLERLHTTASIALLGRKNFEGFQAVWPPVARDDSADPRDRAFAQWLDEAEKVVVSSTLKDSDWQNTRIVNAEPVEVVEELRQQAGGDILVLASSSVIRSLLLADALDQLSILFCPEVLGGGARGFWEDGLPPSSWRLNHSSVSDTGAISTIYDRMTERREPPSWG